MVRVEFLGPIGKPPMELDIQSLQELSDVLKQDSELSEWLKQCAVAVNEQMVTDRNLPLNSGDRVVLLPPVCGG